MRKSILTRYYMLTGVWAFVFVLVLGALLFYVNGAQYVKERHATMLATGNVIAATVADNRFVDTPGTTINNILLSNSTNHQIGRAHV